MHKNIAASFFALIIAAAFAVADAQTAAVTAPQTNSGQVLNAWLKAFDSGKREQLREFLQTYAPAKMKQLDDQLSFEKMTGGFDLRKIVSSTPTKLTALVQERLSDTFAQVTLVLDEQPPHHLHR